MKYFLKVGCILLLLISFIHSAYSQTSVCQLEQDKFCISYSYLRNTSTQLPAGNFDRRYNSDNIKVGLDYGLTDSVKLSLIPDFRLSSVDGSDIPDITPSLAGQGMYSRPIADSFVNFLGVGSLRIQDSKQQLKIEVPHNVSLEAIAGVGVFSKRQVLQNISIAVFADIYCDLQLTNIFNRSLPAITFGGVREASKFGLNWGIGLEAGLEVNLWKRATLIAKLNFPTENPDDGFLILSIVSHYL